MSNDDQDNNECNKDHDNNGSSKDQDISGYNEDQDNNALSVENLIGYFYQKKFFNQQNFIYNYTKSP